MRIESKEKLPTFLLVMRKSIFLPGQAETATGTDNLESRFIKNLDFFLNKQAFCQ